MQILPRLEIGGVERGVLDLVIYFKTSGLAYDIQNIVVSGGGRLIGQLEESGITHYELPVYKKSLFALSLITKLKKIITAENINIIHARSRVPGWLSFFASRGSNTHYVTTIHGIYKNKSSGEVMGWGKFVICPSKAVARHMKDNFGVSEDKIVVINRWVNLNKFTFTEPQIRKKSNTIVSIGRISPSKGYEYLIEGFRKVIRSNPFLTLKIVGSADKSKLDYLEHLKTLVNRFALDRNVQFSGFRQDIENVLKEARLVVAPSVIEEAFPRAVLEACACGIPVVTTNIGGTNEIIENGVEGLSVEPKNSEAIATAILRLLNDNTLADSLALKGRQKVENLYSMEKCLKETQAVYKKATTFFRILVIKISSFGDIILAIPSLKELRERFPEGKIAILTLKKYAPILYGCPYLDEIITLEEDYKKFKNIRAVAKNLRRKAFDYIVDLQNNRASHLISFFAFPRYSFGYSLRLGFLLNKKIKYNRNDDPLTSQERILEFLGIRIKEKKLIFWKKDNTQVRTLLPDADLIGINLSASSRWKSKNWPINHIINLIELIYKNYPTYKVVLIADETAQSSALKIENYLYPKPINLCAKTSLNDLPAVIAKLKVFITPDTANLHLACAMDIPTIALFGPTDPKRHTVKSKNLIIFHSELLCSYCYQPECKLKEKNLCMEKITPQEVFQTIKDILQSS
ncbi:MAG: glycosyltransferase [Candidatus Omnitrophota bacterium]|nr:glycosyltransferase [Candidatus Omnitrophota bacterium]